MEERLWKVVESWNHWGEKASGQASSAVESKSQYKKKPYLGIERKVTREAWRLISGPEAVYFYGPRRSGKTTVCIQLLWRLSEKYGKKSCLYLNFEEPAFAGRLGTDFISEIVAQHGKVHGQKPRFIFLDEVQGVAGWEKWVRRAVDLKECKVFATGSSAKLLSSEFATVLSGRGLGFLVLPFSFSEFRVAIPGADLEDYFSVGGYPAIVLEKDPVKRTRLLEEYFDAAIARDIAARYEVRDIASLRSLAVFVLTNSGKPISYNKLRASTGLSFDAIKLYLSYVEDAFLAFQVPQFSYSMKKAMEKPRKYYAYDLGMQAAVSKSYSPDMGRKAETAVAIELKRRGAEPQYYSNGNEVDFVVRKGLKPTAINICYSDRAPERERAGLEQFAAMHKGAETLMLVGRKAISEWLS